MNSLDVKFFLEKIAPDCILGTPFLSTVEPHGVRTIKGIKGIYLTINVEELQMFLPFISMHRQSSMVHIIAPQNTKDGFTSMSSEERKQIASMKEQIQIFKLVDQLRNRNGNQ